MSIQAPIRALLTFTALAVIIVGLPATSVMAESARPAQAGQRYYGRFAELPVGAVQPRGWIQQWLERQADGLTGHPENMAYPYDTCLYAGRIPPPGANWKSWKEWWPYEQAGYFVDATTRLSWLIQNESISQRRDANIDYILNHSAGTNFGASHWCWPNAVVGRALMAQLSATENPRVQSVIQDWLLTSKDEILKGGRNGANFEAAFYLYGRTGDPRLLQLGRALYENYLTATNSFCTRARILSDAPFHEHGVTVAETLKCLPLMYLYTGDTEALDLARRAYQKVMDNNLMADGGVVSAEFLDPVKFDSLHESCDITDWSWSLGYLAMATGEGKWADLIERTTFNALPGAVTKDFKQFQYFSGVNQLITASDLNGVPHCRTRLTYRAAHDTECCGGNINRAMPNYVSRMWMRSQDGGLSAMFYGPSEISTTLSNQKVVITEETDYPFRDVINFTVKSAKPVTFTLHLRIPTWCTNASLQLNGVTTTDPCNAGNFVALHREFREGDRIVLKLPMAVQIEDSLGGSGAVITRGPIVYSLPVAERRQTITNDSPAIKALLHGNNIQGFPALEFRPAGEWRYGLAAAQKNHPEKISVVESPMSANPFLQSPVHLEVPLYLLPQWAPDWRPASAANPAAKTFIARSPKFASNASLAAHDAPVILTLLPYGSTHLRLTTLPLVSTESKTASASNPPTP